MRAAALFLRFLLLETVTMQRNGVLLGILMLSGCAVAPPPPPANDGYAHFLKSGTFDCPAQPVSIDASHVDVTLQGSCSRVRVTGSHDDVVVYVPPGAAIEVTGSHDDIVWRLIRRGAPPKLINTGDSNSVVRNSRAPWQQDHDWYQEQH